MSHFCFSWLTHILYFSLVALFSLRSSHCLTPDESFFLTLVNLTCSLTLISSFRPCDLWIRKRWPWRSCRNNWALISVKHFQRDWNKESRLWEAMLEFEPQKTSGACWDVLLTGSAGTFKCEMCCSNICSRFGSHHWWLLPLQWCSQCLDPLVK